MTCIPRLVRWAVAAASLLVLGSGALGATGVARADDSVPPPPPTPPPTTPPTPPPVAAPATPPATAPAKDGAKAVPPNTPAPAAAAASDAEGTDWRPGDELEIRVLNRSDLSGTVRVLGDGTIDVPFAGRFRLRGRTLDAVRAEIETGFAKLERSPQVSVTLQSLAPEQFYVLGEVGKAGVYTVPRRKKVSFLQALGMAGGFSTEADFTQVRIVPAGGEKPRLVDASPGSVAALAGVTVADGDTIVVPSVGRIYLMGQVNRTGGFAPPAGEQITLTRAIALGGGFTRLADQKSVLVTWRDGRNEAVSARFNVQMILNGQAPDPVVYPGNLIFVAERLL